MKILIQLSGGLDSVAVLSLLCQRKENEVICPLFFNYGQVYVVQEFRAALYAVRYFQSKGFPVLSLKEMGLGLEVQSNTIVPEYIPYRNLVLTAASINAAAAWNCQAVAVGSKSLYWRENDPYSFKDSTAPFYRDLMSAVVSATEPEQRAPEIQMPIVGWSKADVLLECLKAGLDVKRLWSCYCAGGEPCGECYHCKEISEAYHAPEVQAFMHRAIAS